MRTAAALAGSWRPAPPLLRLSSEKLADILPTLLRTGAAALVGRRLRPANPVDAVAVGPWQDAFRLYTLQSLRHEANVRKLVTLLRAAGIDPLLVKGWAVARLYPERGLRPYVDVDLCVRPDQLPRATEVLREHAGGCGAVDLHAGVADLEDRTWEAVEARARPLPLGGLEVRTLGPEDQLRHLGLHLVRHGGWRPLWLCDLGAALESLSTDFDWDYCVYGERWRSEWLACALGLARRLLGAEAPAGAAPRWLRDAVVHEWGSPLPGDSHSRDDRPLASYWRHPRRWPHALRCRWPNAVEAAFRMGASPFTRLPGVWFQVGACLRRGVRLPAKIWSARGRRPPPFTVHAE